MTDYTNWINTTESIHKDENGNDIKTTFATLLPAQQDEVIKAINEIGDEKKREGLGNAAENIKGKKGTWIFNKTEKKYKLQGT